MDSEQLKNELNDLFNVFEELTEEKIESIREKPEMQNWLMLCCNYKLSEDFIREFEKYLNWRMVSRYQFLSKEILKDFAPRIFWGDFKYKILSIEYIRDLDLEICYRNLPFNLSLTDDLILAFYDKIDWEMLKFLGKINKNIFKKMNKAQQLYVVVNYRDVWNDHDI